MKQSACACGVQKRVGGTRRWIWLASARVERKKAMKLVALSRQRLEASKKALAVSEVGLRRSQPSLARPDHARPTKRRRWEPGDANPAAGTQGVRQRRPS